MNMLSDNPTTWTRKNILKYMKTGGWVSSTYNHLFCQEKLSLMLMLYSSLVIPSSLVFRYIENTTPKINEYQKLHSEPVPTLNS